jgi:hypothetical protein
MRSPINLYSVTTLDEPNEWATETLCAPDYEGRSEAIVGFEAALAAAIRLADRYEARVAILGDPGPEDISGRPWECASVLPLVPPA